jgi:hypothetical protein
MPTLAVGMLKSLETATCPRQAWAWHPFQGLSATETNQRPRPRRGERIIGFRRIAAPTAESLRYACIEVPRRACDVQPMWRIYRVVPVQILLSFDIAGQESGWTQLLPQVPRPVLRASPAPRPAVDPRRLGRAHGQLAADVPMRKELSVVSCRLSDPLTRLNCQLTTANCQLTRRARPKPPA